MVLTGQQPYTVTLSGGPLAVPVSKTTSSSTVVFGSLAGGNFSYAVTAYGFRYPWDLYRFPTRGRDL